MSNEDKETVVARPAEALKTAWAQRGLSASDLMTRSDGTLVASDRNLFDASATLLADETEGRESAPLSPETVRARELLGRGGMGAVYLADQPSLRRAVAIKVTAQPAPPGARSALLKEAWVGGLLEHPNVVPVHLLGKLDGEPALVMKRIEGTSWSSVIADPSAHPKLRIRDPLEWHLRVFAEVCQAVSFAHRKGVLHLDLKPDNVMIGDHGEVYVLDWGLAVRSREHGPHWLGSAKDVRSVAGTPGYMAPELAAADGSSVSERTDVFLLGAVLHHVVTGDVIHRGENTMQILVAAYFAEPFEYAPEVPKELVSILRRACAREPAERFEDVSQLRKAVLAFLEHRHPDRLVRSAIALLDEIEALASDVADTEIEPKLAECEAALDAAARAWPEHPDLEPSLERLVRAQVGHAVRRERAVAARAALGRLAKVDPELEAQVAGLERRLREKAERFDHLVELERNLDLTIGGPQRQRIWFALGSIWAAVCFAYEWMQHNGTPVGYPMLFLEGGVLFATLGPYGWLNRTTLFRNRAARRLWGALIGTAVVVEMLWVAGWIMGLDTIDAIAITSVIYMFAFACLGVVIDSRVLIAASCMLAAVVGCIALPDHTHAWIGLGGGSAAILTARAWARPR